MIMVYDGYKPHLCGGNRKHRRARYLKKTDYLPPGSSKLLVHPHGLDEEPFSVPFTDSMMRLPLRGFDACIDATIDSLYPGHGSVYYKIYEIK